MPKWKRSKVVYLALDDEVVFNLAALLEGRIESTTASRLCAFDLIRSQRIPISRQQLDVLAAIPSDAWVDSEELELAQPLEDAALRQLVDAGLLLLDDGSDRHRRATSIDQSLEAHLWHPDALFFHRMSRLQADDEGRFKDVDIGDVAARSAATAQDFVAEHGPPPPVQGEFDGIAEPLDLPPPTDDGELTQVLRRRRTVRAFDVGKPLKQQHLSQMLHYTFGRFGDVELAPGVQLLKKCSPSGGSLHPMEALPLVLNVEGLTSGFYHYDGVRHRLVPLLALATAEARTAARDLGTGQLYVGEAHVVVALVARFPRNHWKYRQQSRTYGVMLMDAGHLSQTFYLMATQLGLGAFFSGAVDSRVIEDRLGLDPQEHGLIGICGCGHTAENGQVPHQGGLPFRSKTQS